MPPVVERNGFYYFKIGRRMARSVMVDGKTIRATKALLAHPTALTDEFEALEPGDSEFAEMLRLQAKE